MSTKLSIQTQGKLVSQVVTLARKLARAKCSWQLVRYEHDETYGYVDVQSWSSREMDLFGMLAMMITHRDHARGAGMFELVCYAPRRIVAARVKTRRSKRI